jgi:predicted Holliday junction resolvase-like endonuclease
VFVGVLATFVIVGNYAQVKSIEQDFSQKVSELNHEFSKKVKELETEFDKKVFMNQNFQEIKEIYKEMSDSISLVAKLLSVPCEKRKVLSEEGNEHLNGYSTLLTINKFVLPTDLFIIFEEVKGLLSDCFNNNINIASNNEKNIEAEQRIFDKINSDSIKINELKNRIDELLKLKYAIN